MSAKRRILSIRWIVTAAAVLLTAAAVLSVGAVAERHARVALTQELESRLILEARNLALTSTGALLEDFPELTLHPLLKEKLARQPELAFAFVVDHQGTIQGHADPQRLGSRYQPPEGLVPVEGKSPLRAGERLERGSTTLVAAIPIAHASGKTLGSVVVGMHRSHLEDVIGRSRRQQAILLGLFLLVGVAISFLVVSHVLRPMGALRSGIERIAAGDLETVVVVRDRTELGFLADAINEMAGGLRRAQEVMLERERLTHEMELAREIQESLLPSEPIVTGSFVLEGSQKAAAEVGGDYFDYFPLPDGRVGVAIADVSGKGLAGCLVMSMLYSLLRAWKGSYRSPADLLVALDEHLAGTLRSGAFVTMFYGILDPSSGTLTYASAGHNPVFLYRRSDRRLETQRTRGIPLGAIRGGAIRATLEDREIRLGPGDFLLQYTDGINEAFDTSGREQYGFDRAGQVLAETASLGATAVIRRLLDGVREWTGEGTVLDDQTVLVIHRADDPSERDRAALERLAEAKERGICLGVTGGSDLLEVIQEWTRTAPSLRGFGSPDKELLTTALYEVCANIAEHGYASDPAARFELWFIPVAAGEGRFLIRDHGAPFSANGWRGQDFNDSKVRRRGRGLGLEIIHRAMRDITYHPQTIEGNLTCMTFVGQVAPSEEVRHVG